ncbi:MAG: bifunctional folylpolyglutamate synthase/dihydrofolate synthase [Deltaproteobacteria bacterium]|nr:bifunctional folylpolyglutamate synthase/dihydrofolate synthase [Deltaproteobacteria bacterium]
MLTYQQTLEFLYHLEIERMDLKLERVAEALRLCGSPQQRFAAIHVAGTNGKGSTATFLHSMLRTAGYRVGLFTSPHLIDFCERIRLGPRWITEQEVIDGVAEIRAVVRPARIQLTPFEMMTVLAFQAFARTNMQIAVVEVGLGGRLDSTNVLLPLVSVITSIGLDHQAYLGNTEQEIAYEKGGIIKPTIPVAIGQVSPESRAVLLNLAAERNSPAYLFNREFAIHESPPDMIAYSGLHWRIPHLQLGLRGQFQYRNAATALAALELIQPTWPVSVAQAEQGLRTAYWPGRVEVVSHSPLVILDGAHNPQALETLQSELPALVGGRRVKLLFAVMRDKDWRAMIPMLTQLASEVVVTRVQQARAEDPEQLRAAFAPYCPVRTVADAPEACRQLVAAAQPDEAIVVAGSLFLVGEVYSLFSPTVMTTRGTETLEEKC